MKMKEKFVNLLQKLADFIVRRIEIAKSEQEVAFWLATGLRINEWCVKKNIWLN